MKTLIAALIVIAASTYELRAQSPAFEVVSIKKNASGAPGQNRSERPDGGFRMLNVPLGMLISAAYPPAVPVDIVGLPDWAMRERYDVVATSPLQNATPDERIAMLRAMLADRLKLAVHTESREQDVYELVVARKDGRLGPNLKPSEIDCVAKLVADKAAGIPPPRITPESSCGAAAPCPCARCGRVEITWKATSR